MNVSAPKKPIRLRLELVNRGLTASDLAQGAGISVSLALKLMSAHRRPSEKTIGAIEDFLRCRIWSAPGAYRVRQDAEKKAALQQIISSTETGESEEARRITAKRFPDLLPD